MNYRAVSLQVDLEATKVDVTFMAVDTLVWALSGVESLVQL